MTGTISNQEYTLRRDLLNDAIREIEEDLDTLFYGKNKPKKDS